MKTPMFCFILLVCAAAFAAAGSSDPATASADQTTATPVKTLTLDDCVNIAVHDSTAVLKANRDDEFGGTQVLQSYMQFLPNLTAQGAYNTSKGKTFYSTAAPTLVNATNYGANYTISTTLNLFNGFSDIAQWNASHARRDAAEKNVIRAKQQISLDVAQSFLQAALDQQLVAIAEKNLQASKDREALLSEKTSVGLQNKSDLFRQQAQTSADEAFLISTTNKKQDDLIVLLRKLRIDPRENYVLIDPPSIKNQTAHVTPPSPPEETHSIDVALENRQDYDITRLNAEANHSDVTSVRANYLPRIDFVASYLGTSRSFDSQLVNGVDALGNNTYPSLDKQLRDQTNTVYGIVLTWNIFDRWSNTMNVERAKAVAYKSDLDAEDFRRQVIGEVKQAISDYKAAAQQLETSERGLLAARKAYEVGEGRYEVGSSTYVDLAIAQTALVQAEASRAQALVGWELQKRAMDFALGITEVQ